MAMDIRNEGRTQSRKDAGVDGPKVVCVYGSSDGKIKDIGVESGRDPLDRLLTFAMTAVLITIARHIREPQFVTGREAEIDKILERFHPYFPWMDRQKISQAAGGGTDGAVAGKGGSRSKKQQKRPHEKGGDTAQQKISQAVGGGTGAATGKGGSRPRKQQKRPREQGGDTDGQKISPAVGGATGAVTGMVGSGPQKQQKQPHDQSGDTDGQKISYSQAAGGGAGAATGKGGSRPRKHQKRPCEQGRDNARQKISQAEGGGTGAAMGKGGTWPLKQQNRPRDQGGNASVPRDGLTRRKQLESVGNANEGAGKLGLAKENATHNGDNAANSTTDSSDALTPSSEPEGAAARSEGENDAGGNGKGVDLDSRSEALETGVTEAEEPPESGAVLKRLYPGLDYEEVNALHRISSPPIPWSERIATMRAYYEKHGHLNIKKSDPELGHTYGVWLNAMRTEARHFEKTGKSRRGLNASRIAELRSIGLEFGPERQANRFERMFLELEKYKKENGNCKVPRSDNSDLGRWVTSVRGQYYRLMRGSQGSTNLKASEIARLTKIGFVFPKFNTRPDFPGRRSWEEWMAICKQFKEENGHLKIPRAHPTLGGFSTRLRSAYKDREKGLTCNFLTDERFRELDNMGFVWFVRPSRDQYPKEF